MKVLMVSSDRNILKPGSAVSKRMVEYGELAEELHIALLSDKKHSLKEQKISDKVWVYPTDSLNKFLRPLSAIKIAKDINGKINLDLITTQDPFECGWVGMKLKKELKIPLEVQLHTNPFSSAFGGFQNFVRKNFMKKVLNSADQIRVVLESVGDEIIERLKISKAKISVLPIYIDRERVSGEPKFNLRTRFGFKHIILCVSRLSPEKNLTKAIKAISKVKDACLVIVGSGPEEEKLKKLASKLNVGNRVFFEGWKEELVSYYKTSDFFLQTSKFEGYGLALVEAGLCGLPCVSTPVGVAKELKSVIRADEIETLISGIEYLISNDSRRVECGQSLRKELESRLLSKDVYMSKLKNNWNNLILKK